MRVEVWPFAETRLEVNAWYVTKPDSVVWTLQRQLEAAQAVWPELKNVKVVDKRKTAE